MAAGVPARGGVGGEAHVVPHFVLYARAYCHLCDDMIAALAALQSAHRFTVDVIDVDADPALDARYDELVPVLVKDGVEVCHHFLDRDRLEAALAESTPGRTGSIC